MNQSDTSLANNTGHFNLLTTSLLHLTAEMFEAQEKRPWPIENFGKVNFTNDGADRSNYENRHFYIFGSVTPRWP